MSTLVATDAATETYQDVERLIYQFCHKAEQRHGGEWDEYLSTAHEAYAEAYASFEPARGVQFITWLYWQLRWKLADLHRRKAVQYSREMPAGDALDQMPETPSTRFDLGLFIRDLSDDARTVVRMVVESPDEVRRIVSPRSKANYRRGLWKKLKQMGWSLARCIRSFDELREAMQ